MRHLLLAFLIALSSTLGAINDNTASDATSIGLGGTSVSSYTPYAIFNNPALAANVRSSTFLASYNAEFFMTQSQVGLLVPSKVGSFFSSIKRFGSDEYSELMAGIGYTRAFGETFSASLQFDALSVTVPSANKTLWAFTGEIGIFYKPMENLTLGWHLYNFINVDYNTDYKETIPVNMRLGFTYTVFDNFLLTSEVENSSLYGTSIRGGMEYAISPQVFLRCGAASQPVLVSLGLGVKVGKWHLDVAGQAIRDIGKTGVVSLAYTF